MRAMQLDHGEALQVAAAHSRVIQPGDRVDFDEVIFPTNGSPYTLETALGPDAGRFSAAPEPEPVAEPPVVEPVTEADPVEDLPVVEPVTGDVSTVTDVAPEAEPVVEPKATGRGKRK